MKGKKIILKKMVCVVLSIVLVVSTFMGLSLTSAAVTGSEIVAYARQYIGYPYVYGTHGPNSFDCSGFVNYVFGHFGIYIPASTYSLWGYESNYGTIVAYGNINNAKAGDLILWTSHVAIYTENGKCVEALNQKYGVTEAVPVNSHTNGTNYRVIRVYGVNDGNNPQGHLDGIEGTTCAVRVAGWCFDTDDPTQSLRVHVYIGGPAGSGAECHEIMANVSRGDVDNAFHVGQYHGFDSTISTSRTGQQDVYIYAINIGSGNNVEIGHRTVSIVKDSEKPSIQNMYTYKINDNTARWCCECSDNVDVLKVRIAVWDPRYNQNDLVWYDCSNNGYGTWFVDIPYAAHNSSAPKLVGHFYVYDYADNYISAEIYHEKVHNHTSDGGTITTQPTCTQTGVKTYKCTACGETIKTETIPATGHTPGDWEIETEATANYDGLEVIRCTVCTEILEERAIPKLSGPVPGTLYLDKKPSKISYELNEAFDPTGAILRVKYNDGTIKSLSSSDVQIVGFDTTTGGSKKVHFSYTENGVTLNTWEFTILVDRQVTAIFIPHKPNKTHYICGEAFEREGMQIIATYSDGTKADVTAEVRTSGYDSLTFGLKKMTVSYTYKGKTVTLQFSYEMNPKLTGLVLTHKPNKLGTYKVGEPLSKEGMIITAKFSDGSTKDVTHLIRTSGYSSKQVGKQIITVYYVYGTQTKSVQFSIIMSQT